MVASFNDPPSGNPSFVRPVSQRQSNFVSNLIITKCIAKRPPPFPTLFWKRWNNSLTECFPSVMFALMFTWLFRADFCKSANNDVVSTFEVDSNKQTNLNNSQSQTHITHVYNGLPIYDHKKQHRNKMSLLYSYYSGVAIAATTILRTLYECIKREWRRYKDIKYVTHSPRVSEVRFGVWFRWNVKGCGRRASTKWGT